VYFTNPLVVDNDSDGDTFYWFEDCNDSNAFINPDAAESLDGVDNNCDQSIDEGFFESDVDNDSLSDYDEFTNRSTDPYNPDTDGDGLLDGEEVFDTQTDPLVPDLDNDSDGFRWFLDCDDDEPTVSPNQPEIWNGRDDNCDDIIDNSVDRLAHLTQTPNNRTLFLNATDEALDLLVGLDVVTAYEFQNGLGLNVEWYRNGTSVGSGFLLNQSVIDCATQNSTFEQELCGFNGQTGPYKYTAVVSDDYGSANVSWTVYYNVWQPEEETSSSFVQEYSVAIGLGGIIVVLLAILTIQRRRPPEQQPLAYQPVQPFSDVPSAPNLDLF
jgi:hypothetical protein